MQRICLAMIVKDEAAVIERCLASVLPYVHHWTIVDTGSTDGTQDLIRSFFEDHKVPGELVERPWVDFGHNRTEALTYARNSNTDYALMIDADDVLTAPPGFEWPELDKDCYVFTIRHVSIEFPRTQLFKNTVPWRYRGVIHEFPDCNGHRVEHTVGSLPLVMQTSREGARSQDPQKYHRDVEVLEKAIETEEASPVRDEFLVRRYTFYLAQSYRDADYPAKAMMAYLGRTEMGGYQDEIFYSFYQAMKIAGNIGSPPDEGITKLYQCANEVSAGRAEHAVWYARWLRERKRFDEAVAVLRTRVGSTMPPGSLFGEPWVYQYGILDELSVSLYWYGQPADGLKLLNMMLQNGPLPREVLERVAENAKQFFLKLGS